METAEVIAHADEVLGLHNNRKRVAEGQRIFELLPQGEGSGLNADMVDGKHAKEIVEEAREGFVVKAVGSGGGSGMAQHGNEFHTPDFLPKDGSEGMTSDLLPASPEVYNIGSDSKPWLRGFWQGRNTVLDMLGKLIVGGKFPTGHPRYTGEEAVPYIDFYCEYPIGTKTARYIISNYYGSLTFSGISADELTQIDMMGFDFPSTTFFVASHFQPAYEGLDLGSPLHPVFPVRWRDVGIQRYTFMGKTENGLPTADETMRGVMIRVEGAAGVADKLYCCMKKADNTYAWIQVASG